MTAQMTSDGELRLIGLVFSGINRHDSGCN